MTWQVLDRMGGPGACAATARPGWRCAGFRVMHRSTSDRAWTVSIMPGLDAAVGISRRRTSPSACRAGRSDRELAPQDADGLSDGARLRTGRIGACAG